MFTQGKTVEGKRGRKNYIVMEREMSLLRGFQIFRCILTIYQLLMFHKGVGKFNLHVEVDSKVANRSFPTGNRPSNMQTLKSDFKREFEYTTQIVVLDIGIR